VPTKQCQGRKYPSVAPWALIGKALWTSPLAVL